MAFCYICKGGIEKFLETRGRPWPEMQFWAVVPQNECDFPLHRFMVKQSEKLWEYIRSDGGINDEDYHHTGESALADIAQALSVPRIEEDED